MSILPIFPQRELTIVRGQGVRLYDDSGKTYLDALSNYGVNILGYAHPAIDEVFRENRSGLINLHGSFANDLRNRYAERLVAKVSTDLGHEYAHVYFSSSGAEAVEAALKFARMTTRRTTILSALMGYHGKTMGALSATRTAQKYRDGFEPLVPGFEPFRYNDPDDLAAKLSGDTAAVILELIQGEGGIRSADLRSLQAIADLCRTNRTLLIVDEIQTGMGRTGTFLVSEQFGIKPDILTMSKGIACGYPFAATILTAAVSANIVNGSHTSTFAGGPLACLLADRVLDLIEAEGFLAQVNEMSALLVRQLQAIDSPLIREIRGRGLMIGIELKKKVGSLLKTFQEEGVLVGSATATVLRLLPPLIIGEEDIRAIVATIEKVLTDELS